MDGIDGHVGWFAVGSIRHNPQRRVTPPRGGGGRGGGGGGSGEVRGIVGRGEAVGGSGAPLGVSEPYLPGGMTCPTDELSLGNHSHTIVTF